MNAAKVSPTDRRMHTPPRAETMTERAWAAFAMRVAEQDMDSLSDVFDIAKKFSQKII